MGATSERLADRCYIQFKAKAMLSVASRPPMVGWTSSCAVTPCLSSLYALIVLVLCRAKTSIQQRLPAQLEDKLEKFVDNFRTLRETHHFPDTMIVNMEETPLYFDMPSSHSVHRKGCREVRVRSTGAEKRRLTIILACTAAGQMLPPMIIFKQKGWNDASLTLVWIQNIYKEAACPAYVGHIYRAHDRAGCRKATK